ncbi:MAG: amino acid adenylation domain-containing protein [Aurantibacter sp.]
MEKEKPSISLLSQWKNRDKKVVNTIEKMPEGNDVPLSRGQRRLWFLQNLYPENSFYNLSERYIFHGELQVQHLKNALQLVVADHDLLRSSYPEVNGKSIIKIADENVLEVQEHDLSGLPSEEADIRAKNIMSAQDGKYFELSTPPLIRASLLKFSESEHLLFLTLHHIITDEWSMNILRAELAANYKALCDGKEIVTRPPGLKFSDYAYWQQQHNEYESQLAYWKDKLTGEIPILDLQTDHKAPLTPSYKGRQHKREYSVELSQKTLELSKKLETTPFVLLLSVYYILLHKYTGQEDLLVGSPMSGRNNKSLENIFGFFLDTMVLRSQVKPTDSFLELVQQVKIVTRDAFEHKDVPFDLLVKELKIKRLLSVNPFFQVMFVYNAQEDTPSFGQEVKLIEGDLYDSGVAKFDLTFYIAEKNGKLSSILEYATDLFEEPTVLQYQEHFELLLKGVTSDPQKQISEIGMLTLREEAVFFPKLSEEIGPFEKFTGIHEIISRYSKKTPDVTAVVFADTSLTYQELIERADALALSILEFTKGKNEIVGLCMDRSVEMIIGMLAILKAGCAYLPLDSDYPAQRINFMLQDSKVKVVLSQNALKSVFDGFQGSLISVDGQQKSVVDSTLNLPALNKDDLAYVIYTSGSTGNPKGVPITHKNIINSTQGRLAFYENTPSAFLLMSSIAFDSSKAGIFWTLCTGGTLVIAEKRIEQDIEKMCDIIASNEVTHTLMLPTLYKLVLEYGNIPKLLGLNTVIVAGESCYSSLGTTHFEKLPQVKLYNEYGPTEATVWCVAHQLKADQNGETAPIGKPVANAVILLLNDLLDPVPFGAVGEIYIGGPGLSGSYLNRPELSKEAYVQNPFSNLDTKLLYKTGDLARYNNQGDLEFLGRSDQQVKIRGFRVELEEIEQVIAKESMIEEAVVLVGEIENGTEPKPDFNSPKQLVAYLRVGSDYDPITLKGNLKKTVPEHMIPTSFIVVAEFPKLPNGKVNRNDLLKIKGRTEEQNKKSYSTPENETQKKLVEIWEDVLNFSPVGIHDNFFEIGGDSISSIQIISKARKAGIELQPNQIFENQTIATLALFAKKEVHEALTEEPLDSEFIPLTPIQSWFFEVHTNAPHYWNQIVEFSSGEYIDPSAIERIGNELVAYHDALRLSFIQDGSTWKAQVLSADSITAFYHFDLEETSKISDRDQRIKSTLTTFQENCRLEEGNLFRVLYFECGTRRAKVGKVFIVCHHLVTDMVSWHSIFSDFLMALKQLGQNENISFKQKTASIKAWGVHLLELSKTKKLQEELVFWKKQHNDTRQLPTDFDFKGRLFEEGSIAIHTATLTKKDTVALLSEANDAYNTKIEDLLITVLLETICEWGQLEEFCLGLERHGRPKDNELINVSNTIGWFTSFFPVTLQNTKGDLGNKIKGVKEQLRTIPNDGIGYGILKYISDVRPENHLDQSPQLIFNYLGKQGNKLDGIQGKFQYLLEGARDPRSERTYMIEINSYVSDDQLIMNWSYSTEIHKESTIIDLAGNFEKSLGELIAHCAGKIKKEFTPSDFPEADLSQDDLDSLMNKLGE